ncbi:MAG: 4Fe-4S binding protein [Nanoarchaeota archaeon]|nr:4Fe-4S binding protein [Nanoarchaeota archaeon]
MNKKVILRFPEKQFNHPVMSSLTKEFGVLFNILKADINAENNRGTLIVEFIGESEQIADSEKRLKELGIKTEPLSQEIKRIEDNCTHCSACTVHCPTGALSVPDRKTMIVEFEASKCIACGNCAVVCPYKAMQVKF